MILAKSVTGNTASAPPASRGLIRAGKRETGRLPFHVAINRQRLLDQGTKRESGRKFAGEFLGIVSKSRVPKARTAVTTRAQNPVAG